MSLRGGRATRFPPPGRDTLHCIGDAHFLPSGPGNQGFRSTTLIRDLNFGDVPDVPVHLQLGDGTDDAASASDAAALAWAAALPGDMLWVIGNHDVDLHNNTRTPAQWAGVYGTPGGSQNYTYDLPWARIIAVGFDSMADGDTVIRLSDATMTWLDAQLTAAGNTRCYIACHAPLYDTLGITPTVGTNASTIDGNYVLGGSSVSATASNSQQVIDLLASHGNVAAWISGHTHNSIETPQIVNTATAGSHTFATINTSCVWMTDANIENWDRACTPYLTDYGDQIEVRWRDHLQRQWTAPWNNPTARIMTATGLTAS